MKKIVSLVVLVSITTLFSPFVGFTPQTAQAKDPHYVEPNTVIIDGDLSEWSSYDNLLLGEEANVKGITYYWDLVAEDWTTTNPGYETITTNIDQMFDFITMKMVHDDDYMYMMNEKVAGLYSVNIPFSFGQPGPQIISAQEQVPEGTYEMPYSFDYPSPVDVNVDQVMMFDTDSDGNNDYYVVINFQWNKGDYWDNMPTKPSPNIEPPFNVLGSLYQESDVNGGTYNGRNSETFIQDFNASDVSMMPEMMDMENPTTSETSKEEGKQSRSIIFDKMDIDWNDSVKLSYATLYNSSTTLKAGESAKVGEAVSFIDQLATVDYTFDAAEPIISPKILTTSGPGEVTRLQAYSKATVDGSKNLLEEDITGLFPESYLGGAGIVPIDQNNNGVLDQFLLFAINNGGPQVLVRGLKEDGSLSSLGQMFVFDSSIRDGLSAISGDFDNDGYQDDAAFCLTGDRAPEVRVYTDVSGIDNWELANSFTAPFGNVGCNLGTFQYNNGADEILVTPNHGPADPYVYIYKADGTLLYNSFLAYETSINQGLTAVGAGERIYTTPNNGSSQVNAFDKEGNRKNFWWVYEEQVRKDFIIRAAQLDPADEAQELLISPMGANGSHIVGYEPSGIQRPTPNFFAFGDPTLRNGVGIATIDNWHGVN